MCEYTKPNMQHRIALGLTIGGLAALAAGITHAQSPTAASPRFEVASIKTCRSEPDAGRGGKSGGGGRIRWDPAMLHEECQSVYNLIRDAYLAYPEGKRWTGSTREEPSPNARGVDNGGCTGCGIGLPPVSDRLFRQSIQGSPGWVESARYTIDAKAERPATPEMMRGPMMQALLEDRFQLKIRREMREVPVYELTVAPGGAKPQVSTEGSCLSFSEMIKLPPRRSSGQRGPIPCGAVAFHDGKAEFPGTTMAGLCRTFSELFDRDVVDKTGMAGFYNVEVAADRVVLASDDSAPPRPDGTPPPPQTDRIATFKAFQRALPKIGLKLEPARGQGVFLVIDHIERPSEN